MSQREAMVRARRAMRGNSEVRIHDAITGGSWRANHGVLPMRINAFDTRGHVHIGCTHELYIGEALRLNMVLTLVADPPEGVRCIICTEEF